MLVEERACDKAHEAHDDGARQDYQAGDQGRVAHVGLQVDGHENAGGEQGRLDQHTDDAAREEALVGKHAHVEHGVGQPQLAHEEPDGQGHAAGGEHDVEQGKPVGPDVAEAVEREAEAGGRQDDRGDVEGGGGVDGLALFQGEQTGADHHEGADGDAVKEDVPVVKVDDGAGDAGAHGGGKGHDEAKDAHGASAALRWKGQHEHGHDHRHEDTGAGGLQEPSEKQDREVGSPPGHQAAEREGDHRHGEEPLDGEAVGQEGCDGDHDGVDKGEAGGQPLGHRGVDVHLDHDGGQCGRDEGLVEHGHKGAKDHDRHRGELLACER